MVENLNIQQTSRLAFLLSWTSTIPGATFYVYEDGVLVATTANTQWTISVAPGESPVLEVLDDPDAIPEPGYPGYLTLTWYAVNGVAEYLVQELVGSDWITRQTIAENGGGYYLTQTATLADSVVHSFRVLPVGTNENNGTAAELVCLMVRHPDVPIVTYAYNAGTGAVTVAAA